MRCRSTIAITTALALFSVPVSAAHLEAPTEATAGVLPISIEGKLPPKGSEILAKKIDEGLAETGTQIVPVAELESSAGTSLAGCVDEACRLDVATLAAVTHLIAPSIGFDGSDYAMTIEVIDGATGTVVKTVTDVCELCGLSEAADKVASLAASVADSLVVTSVLATLTVVSDPPGARVLVDDRLVGTTPVELEFEAGDRQVIVRKEGYLDRSTLVALEAGAASSLDVQLDPSGPIDDGSSSSEGVWGKIRPVVPWVSIGVGVAALGSGIALLAIDENPVEFTRCSGDEVDSAGNCRFRHNTLAGGVVMTLVGIGGIAAGTVLLILDKKKAGNDDRRVRLRPTHNGLALRF